uniref:(northern house mosquito) hypothetical protein n=1 Tax=Culex pipiens TaxID=7175 RepID=A0A8D8G4V1_CULPI
MDSPKWRKQLFHWSKESFFFFAKIEPNALLRHIFTERKSLPRFQVTHSAIACLYDHLASQVTAVHLSRPERWSGNVSDICRTCARDPFPPPDKTRPAAAHPLSVKESILFAADLPQLRCSRSKGRLRLRKSPVKRIAFR